MSQGHTGESDGWGCNYGLTPSPVVIVAAQDLCVNEDTGNLQCRTQQLRS